jgi:hypothetical protein
MIGGANRVAGINRRAALVGLRLGEGFATMMFPCTAAENPIVETACGKGPRHPAPASPCSAASAMVRAPRAGASCRRPRPSPGAGTLETSPVFSNADFRQSLSDRCPIPPLKLSL